MTRSMGLKTRMLLLFGGLMTVLMLIISLSVLYQWRQLIISDRIRSARLLAQSLSFSVLDALIYEQNHLSSSEAYLQNFIIHYKKHNPSVRFIAVRDHHNRLLAHSELSRVNPPTTANANPGLTTIYRHPRLGWIVQTNYPLRIGQKWFGTLQVAFDATDTQQAIRHLFFLLVFLTLITVSVVLAVIYGLTQKLTRSLSLLVREMDSYELQGSITPLNARAKDEIGILMAHFQAMQERLNRSGEQLLAAQRQIYQAEKLASIGRLASGVAHQINNPLNGLKHFLYLLQQKPSAAKEYLKLMEEGLNHIENVIKKLLQFSRFQPEVRESVQINQEIELVLSLLSYRLEQKQISIVKDLDSRIPPIIANRQLIQEVFMNLLINSFDALPEKGAIKITTRLKGAEVLIEIHDNGSGIPDEIKDKIFEPFFTTKEEGQGTGLGLSVAMGIVQSLGGSIQVNSKTGDTTFVILLPVKESTPNKE